MRRSGWQFVLEHGFTAPELFFSYGGPADVGGGGDAVDAGAVVGDPLGEFAGGVPLVEPVLEDGVSGCRLAVEAGGGLVEGFLLAGDLVVDRPNTRRSRSSRRPRVSQSVIRLARQHRVGRGNGVQVGLELFDQIASGHPPEQLPARRRQTRITGPAGPAALLEQLVTNTHAHHHAARL